MITKISSRFTRLGGGLFFDCAYLSDVPPDLVKASIAPLTVGWDATISEARHSLGRLLAPQGGVSYAFEPDRHVTLFNNTTSALARVLSRIERKYAGSDPTLLTTDLEYPGCVAAIDDGWTGPVVMARVTAQLLEAQDPDSVLHEALIRSHNFVKPRVVFVSHVMRTTGQVLAPRTLINLRELNPRVILVLDGSQAVGNVEVTTELLEHVDFYVASGHKWLGGLTTSGFVWSRDPERWTVADPAQAFAYPGQLGGSGNSAAWVSLIGSIQDMTLERPKSRLNAITGHNRRLGRIFLDGLAPERRRIKLVTPTKRGLPPGGMMTLGVTPEAGRRLDYDLKSAGFRFTGLSPETVHWRSRAKNRFLLRDEQGSPSITRATVETSTNPEKARRDFRFCFHYWHDEKDVRALSAEVVASLSGSRGGAGRPP